ncbi:MAG TPA: sensor domain-containing diguanylate cyclase [Bryobacteraceae bacterium]|nr:sensor domain-containing diguanylate cyclase [Bryobacteraceae bacterium]
MGRPRGDACVIVAVALAALYAGACARAPYASPEALTSVAQIRRLPPERIYAGVEAHLRGVVTYAFSNEESCFIQDSTGGIRIQLRRGQMVGESGNEMEVWGKVTSAGDTPALSEPRFQLLESEALPAAEPFSAEPRKAGGLLYRRVSVTGVVQSAVDSYTDFTTLALRTGDAAVRIKAASPTFSDPERLIDSEIRIEGVLVALPGSGDSDTAAIWAPDLAQVVVLKPAPSPRESPPRSIASLRGLARRQLPAHRILIQGRLEAAPGGLSITDATGRIPVIPGTAAIPQAGGARALAGFAALRNGRLVLVNAVDLARVAAHPLELPVQTTAGAIHRLSSEEASRRYPVKLRGVVTYADAFNGVLFVQDRTEGIFVSLDDGEGGVLRPQDWIEVTGETTPGSFAPSVTRAHFRLLGHAPLPPPDAGSIEAVSQGERDCRWVEIDGVIQGAEQGSHETVAQVLAGTHRLQARILAPAAEINRVVNAEVRLRGVAGALFNDRRQMLGIVIYVPGRDYIQVVHAAPADPFDLPLRPVITLMQFAAGPTLGHRVRLHGVVTASEVSGPTMVKDSTGSVMIRDHNDAHLAPGDIVDVVGFPAIGPYNPFLTNGLIRKTASGANPAPQPLTADEILDGDYDAELVQVDGILGDRIIRGGRLVLMLRSGHIQFMAHLPAGNLPRMPEPGAEVRVTGICALQVDDSRQTVAPRSFEIWMRSPADLTIVKQPSWLTFERLLPIFLITVLIAGVAVFWASRLRRRLRAESSKLVQKTAQLEKEHQETTRALRRAREAEVMEQAHKHVLELVARDEDLDSVLMRLAQAVEEHCIGVSCSIQLRLPDGHRLGASPSVAPGWQQVLTAIPIDDFCGRGVHALPDLASAPAWKAIADPRVAGRFQRFCMAPIERESRRIGVVIAFLAGELVLRRSELDFLVSASKLASLALERRVLYDRLSYQAEHDELTGLENRAVILTKLSREIATAAVRNSLLGVIYIDLDDFKNINDTHGHAAGDAVLCEAAKRMLAGVRRSDSVARLGGDEFVVVLPGLAQRADAYRIASQLVADLARPISFSGQMLTTGASAGISLFPDDGEDAETLLKAADARMYSEKKLPRYNPSTEPLRR